MADDITVQQLKQMQTSSPVVLLDVRTDAEVERGVIAGARHIPLHMLPLRCGELDAGAALVVYCQSGGRSGQACGWLSAQGFGRVSNLQGGIVAWVREGNPVTHLS
ncbi:MAG: rhodanese-like domain-containing protein [Burkholderiales bacterium]|nr:rhodanese-like domain-containing protein [Burkholderiales bacterium]